MLGGVPRRGIFDNSSRALCVDMRTAVDRVGIGKMRQGNARFAAMASHYLFEPTFCSPAAGWEKGQVEKNVQDACRQLWQAMPGLTVDLVNLLEQEKTANKAGHLAESLLRLDLVILDELGYLPFRPLPANSSA